MAIERMGGPRTRVDYTTIPDADYRKQYALMLLEIACIDDSGFADADQQRGYAEHVLPALQRLRDIDDKDNRRGLLAIAIGDVRSAFRHVMGEHWTPNPDLATVKVAAARGLTL